MSIIKDLMCLHLCVNVKVDCEFAFLQKGEQFCSKSHYTSYGEGGGGINSGKIGTMAMVYLKQLRRQVDLQPEQS